MTDPQSGGSTYVYDALNRMSALKTPQGKFAVTYDALNRRTQLTRPNALNTTYSYDAVSNLLSVLHQKGVSTLDGATYVYDTVGNRSAKTDSRTSATSNYAYDLIYELTGATQGSTTTESYNYDAVGNRLSSLGLSPYMYNSSNEITALPGTTYTYDNNGNALSSTVASSTTSYSWDCENRLTTDMRPGTAGTVTV